MNIHYRMYQRTSIKSPSIIDKIISIVETNHFLSIFDFIENLI